MEFLNASSFFIVLFSSDFAFGFQALWSWALLVPEFLQFSHGGLHVFLEYPEIDAIAFLSAPGRSAVEGDGHGVRRTQSLAWLVVGLQMYRMMPPRGAIIPAREGWAPGRHTHVCRAFF